MADETGSQSRRAVNMEAENARLHDTLAELAAATDEWIAGLNRLRDTLQAMEIEVGSVAFEEAWEDVGVDRATLDDFLAFDGRLESVTDRMMATFIRVVGALK
jgi:hypothetical protein